MRNDTPIHMLEPIWLDATVLRSAPWNYKTDGGEELRERFRRSLEQGVTPLHVAKVEGEDAYEVCDGNHRLEELRAIGAKRILCFTHGELPLAERKALAVRYNAQWFHAETVPLAECLRDITEAIPGIEDTLSYDEVDLSRMIAALNIDLASNDAAPLDDEEEELPGPRKGHTRKEKSVKVIECPHCGREFNV